MTIVNSYKKKSLLAIVMLTFLLFSAQVFGQSMEASLAGTVQDSTGGIIPGATVTATNINTNIETTVLTNDSGVYNFPSLQPGTYTVAADLEGFQKLIQKDVELSANSQNNLDFELNVEGMSEKLEVVTTAQDILTESSATAGTVLSSQEVIDLPMLDNDVLALVNIMGGVQAAPDGQNYLETQSFAGVDTRAINIQQDGLTINDVRYKTGINSNTRINPEMVAEFKLVLSPVDAEYGRGMGQVQIITKSGTNAYHGSGVWNIRNSALNANTWQNNLNPNYTKNWFNNHQYNLTFSGPIIKNKTFFFVSWDHSIPRSRSWVDATVLTPCAKKGIYRFFSGWNNGNYETAVSQGTGDFAPPTRPSVDRNGVPLDRLFMGEPYNITFYNYNPDATFFEKPQNTDPEGDNYYADADPTQALQFISVFGPLTEDAIEQVKMDQLNCSYYTPYESEAGPYDHTNPLSEQSLAALGVTGYWETPPDPELGYEGIYPTYAQRPYRRLDTTFISGFSALMPEANAYDISGDGLNTAVHRWQRNNRGSDNNFGTSASSSRKNITTRINHNFSDRHRLTGTYTLEFSGGDLAASSWPDGFAGRQVRRPQRVNVSFTSTLRPGLLNEARFGLNRNKSYSNNALDNPETKDEVYNIMQTLLPTTDWGAMADNLQLVVKPTMFTSSHFLSSGSVGTTWGGYDHRWQMGDTLTWIRGKHSLKFGGELRLTRSYQRASGQLFGNLFTPTITGGVQRYSEPYDIKDTAGEIINDALVGSPYFGELNIFGMTFPYGNYSSGTVAGVINLRDYLAGSIGVSDQNLFINQPDQLEWNSPDERFRVNDLRYKEMAFFAKDDWKVTNTLTLNLGLRWEYYGVPYVKGGMTTGLVDGANGLFGISGRDFSYWMPEVPVDYGKDYLSQQIFIGPESPNENVKVFNKDLNNLGPAVGFAYQLPWFGRGKTTLRGGYQLSFTQVGNANLQYGFGNVLATNTGTNYDYEYRGAYDKDSYMRIADLKEYFPFTDNLDPSIKPLNVLKIENHSQTIRMYDPYVRNPYTQSLNLSVSRRIGSLVTLDVRYVGTLARKNISDIELNTLNWDKNGLMADFDTARTGGTTDRLDNMFRGLSFTFTGSMADYTGIAVGQPDGPTGGDVLRLLFAQGLANGNYNDVANNLADYNFDDALNPPWIPSSDEKGALLRYANTMVPGQQGQFPENFLLTNPQLESSLWTTNNDHNNYHSMQVRFTLRPTHGFNFSATYTWGKNLGVTSFQSSSGYSNPNDRANPWEYSWTGNNRQHQLNTNGSITLPFGANGFFFRDVSNPVVRRIIEGWQMSWIMSLSSGGWTNLTANVGHMWGGTSVPNVGNVPFDTNGKVTWEPGDRYGYYFGDPNRYVIAADPQCTNLVQENYTEDGAVDNARSLSDDCTLQAMYLSVVDDDGIPVRDDSGNLIADLDQIVFLHPGPGEYGNLGKYKAMGIGSFSLDMALSKTFALTEGKSVGIRVNGGNILNHPSPGNPSFAVRSGTPFGRINSKTGSRSISAQITLRF